MKPESAKILLRQINKGIAKSTSCSEHTLNLLQSQSCLFNEAHVIMPLPPWEHFHPSCENSMLMYGFNQWNYVKLTDRMTFRKSHNRSVYKKVYIKKYTNSDFKHISEELNYIEKNYFLYCKLKTPLWYFSWFLLSE